MSVEAIRMALAAEHAAIFGYGVVGAYLAGDARFAQDLREARKAETVHRDRRDEAALRVEAGGGEIVGAEPAYALPFQVTDAQGALRLAAALEEGTAGAWREALSGTSDDDRRFALDAFIASAVTATQWRMAAGVRPVTLTFPGGPS
jgi:hypothetical protein